MQTKIKSVMLAAAAAFILASCSDDDTTPRSVTLTFDETTWDALIDTPQYGGPLLYGGTAYTWHDTKTQLASEFTDAYGDGMFWGGGVVISNYVSADLTHNTYEYQLEVPVSNGSRNFAVANSGAYIYFKDGTPRRITSISYSPTTYVLAVEKNGNDYARALNNADDYLKVVATGYVGTTQTAAVDLYLTRNGVQQEGWQTVSLAQLGAVTKVVFTFEGSDTGDWGLNTPTYVAIDNITVQDAE